MLTGFGSRRRESSREGGGGCSSGGEEGGDTVKAHDSDTLAVTLF